MKELIGKKIVQAYMSMDKTILGFLLDNGDKLTYFTEGECCSNSWIEHVSNSECLVGGFVLNVQDIDVPGVDDPSDDECIRCYGMKIVLDGRPAFEFEFRNASNGYYGGYIKKNSIPEDEWRKLLILEEYEKILTCQEVLDS